MRWFEVLLSVVFQILAIVGAVVVDPFSYFSNAEVASQRILNQALAGGYPALEDNPIVVLEMESELREITNTWPPTPEEYQRIVSTILRAGPSVLFLDLVFDRPRVGSNETTEDALRRWSRFARTVRAQADQQSIKLFAGDYNGAERLARSNEPSANSPTPDTEKSPNEGIFDKYGVMRAVSDHIHTLPVTWKSETLGYRMQVQSQEQRIAIDNPRTTPARVLTHAYCDWVLEQDDLENTRVCDRILKQSEEEGLKTATMRVFWGGWVEQREGYGLSEVCPSRPDIEADTNDRVRDNDRKARTELASRWFWEQFWPWQKEARTEHTPRPLSACPYHQALPLSWALSNDFNTMSAFADAVDEKIVIVGRSDGADQWDSPVHGSIPGAYLHAMAIDNLLVYGNQYWKGAGEDNNFWNRVTEISFLIIVTLAFSYYVVFTDHSFDDFEYKIENNQPASWLSIPKSVGVSLIRLVPFVAILGLMGVTIALTVSTRLADFAWLAFAQGFILLIFLAIAQMLTKTILVTVTYLRRPRAVDDEESLGDIR